MSTEAGANTVGAEYRGNYAMVMDAEMLGIAMSLEQGHGTVALDSQGAITRAVRIQLYTEPTRPWIEQRLQNALAAQPRKLMWVKGHTGIKGNEEAGRRVNLAAYGWRVTARPHRVHVTAAGIRQDFPTHAKPKH